MLATFIIGLREGLEAALIVGIVAAFLKNNGRSLAPMWIGVGLALLLSLCVGAGLALIEKALPQAAQEGMETIIGAIAVAFVTGMVVWMNTHARDMKRTLEAGTAEALGGTGALALAVMAFLAVLREGFETAIFLLATFSAAQSAAYAAGGAVIGLLVSTLIGSAIYAGGVRINLSKFFRLTGAFLILVAAGLVLSSLRTAHEAGWLNAGQQTTVDLAWLVAPGTIRSALMTGVLGIPADPRLVEAIGWLAYVVPVSLAVYWPAERRPAPKTAARLRRAAAAAFVVVAGLLIAAPSMAPPTAPDRAPLTADGTPVGTMRLARSATTHPTAPPDVVEIIVGATSSRIPLAATTATTQTYDGLETEAIDVAVDAEARGRPEKISLGDLVTLAGGRLPTGISPERNPGPFTADWSLRRTLRIWTVDGLLFDAAGRDATLLTLSGGGLRTPRSLTVRDTAGNGTFTVDPAYRDALKSALLRFHAQQRERHFWSILVPALLLAVAILFIVPDVRNRRPRWRRTEPRASAPNPTPTPTSTTRPTKGKTHALHL